MTIQSGYPSLLNKVGQIQSKGTLLVADAKILLNMLKGPQWGIFDQDTGKPAITPDAILAEEIRREWQISQAPVEQGGFQSYNKVALPTEIRVRMTKGGTVIERAEFLSDFDQLAASTNVYNVVSPDFTFMGFTVNRYQFSRTHERGAGLVTVEIGMTEVRTVGTWSGLVRVIKAPSASPSIFGVKIPSLSEVKSKILSAVT